MNKFRRGGIVPAPKKSDNVPCAIGDPTFGTETSIFDKMCDVDEVLRVAKEFEKENQSLKSQLKARKFIESSAAVELSEADAEISNLKKKKKKEKSQLLNALEYLAKEYCQIHGEDSLPGFVEAALEIRNEI